MLEAEPATASFVPVLNISSAVVPHLVEARSGVVLGMGGGAIHVRLDEFVLTITRRTVPLMPNGISLAGSRQAPIARRGSVVRFLPGRILIGSSILVWNPGRTPTWDARVHDWSDQPPGQPVQARGEELLAVLRISNRPRMSRIVDELCDHLEIATTNAGRQGIKLLLQAVAEHDSTLARASSDILTGLGTGLTPEGDDVLAAAAVATRALSPAVGFSFPASWVSSLIPDDHARRTNLVSSCLLHLSAGGFSFEPVVSILNPRIGELDLRSAVGRLLRLGHSTGHAYAVCIALTALVLGQTVDRNGDVNVDR